MQNSSNPTWRVIFRRKVPLPVKMLLVFILHRELYQNCTFYFFFPSSLPTLPFGYPPLRRRGGNCHYVTLLLPYGEKMSPVGRLLVAEQPSLLSAPRDGQPARRRTGAPAELRARAGETLNNVIFRKITYFIRNSSVSAVRLHNCYFNWRYFNSSMKTA